MYKGRENWNVAIEILGQFNVKIGAPFPFNPGVPNSEPATHSIEKIVFLMLEMNDVVDALGRQNTGF